MTAANAAYAVNPQRQPDAYLSNLPRTGFARLPAVAYAAGVAHSTIWMWVREGKFPKPVKISERVTGWRVEDVHAFLMDPQGWRQTHARGTQ